MSFRTRLLPFVSLLLWGIHAGRADDVPVAPLQAVHHETYGQVYELNSKRLKLVISPEEGAVVSILHQSAGEEISSPLRIMPTGAPLPPEFQKVPWEHRAWRSSGGKQVVMLSRSLGPPYSLRIVHHIELNTDGESYHQITRITGTGPGDHQLLAPVLRGLVPAAEKNQASPDGWLFMRNEQRSHWRSQWEIEFPPQQLPAKRALETTNNKPVYLDRPGENFQLPPQGWTLLCNLSITWSEDVNDMQPPQANQP